MAPAYTERWGVVMRRLRALVDRSLERVLAMLMALMVVNVCWQIVTRFVLRNPSSFTEEAARFLLIWVGLLGASYALGQRMHLAIDVLARWQPAWRPGLRAGSLAATAAFAFLVLGVGGARLVLLTLELGQTSAALGWSLGYVYVALPLCGALMTFYALSELSEREW